MNRQDWDKIIKKCAEDYSSIKNSGITGKSVLPPRDFIRAWMQTNYDIFKLSGYFYRMFNAFINNPKSTPAEDVSESVNINNAKTDKEDIKNQADHFIKVFSNDELSNFLGDYGEYTDSQYSYDLITFDGFEMKDAIKIGDGVVTQVFQWDDEDDVIVQISPYYDSSHEYDAPEGTYFSVSDNNPSNYSWNRFKKICPQEAYKITEHMLKDVNSLQESVNTNISKANSSNSEKKMEESLDRSFKTRRKNVYDKMNESVRKNISSANTTDIINNTPELNLDIFEKCKILVLLYRGDYYGYSSYEVNQHLDWNPKTYPLDNGNFLTLLSLNYYGFYSGDNFNAEKFNLRLNYIVKPTEKIDGWCSYEVKRWYLDERDDEEIAKILIDYYTNEIIKSFSKSDRNKHSAVKLLNERIKPSFSGKELAIDLFIENILGLTLNESIRKNITSANTTSVTNQADSKILTFNTREELINKLKDDCLSKGIKAVTYPLELGITLPISPEGEVIVYLGKIEDYDDEIRQSYIDSNIPEDKRALNFYVIVTTKNNEYSDDLVIDSKFLAAFYDDVEYFYPDHLNIRVLNKIKKYISALQSLIEEWKDGKIILQNGVLSYAEFCDDYYRKEKFEPNDFIDDLHRRAAKKAGVLKKSNLNESVRANIKKASEGDVQRKSVEVFNEFEDIDMFFQQIEALGTNHREDIERKCRQNSMGSLSFHNMLVKSDEKFGTKLISFIFDIDHIRRRGADYRCRYEVRFYNVRGMTDKVQMDIAVHKLLRTDKITQDVISSAIKLSPDVRNPQGERFRIGYFPAGSICFKPNNRTLNIFTDMLELSIVIFPILKDGFGDKKLWPYPTLKTVGVNATGELFRDIINLVKDKSYNPKHQYLYGEQWLTESVGVNINKAHNNELIDNADSVVFDKQKAYDKFVTLLNEIDGFEGDKGGSFSLENISIANDLDFQMFDEDLWDNNDLTVKIAYIHPVHKFSFDIDIYEPIQPATSYIKRFIDSLESEIDNMEWDFANEDATEQDTDRDSYDAADSDCKQLLNHIKETFGLNESVNTSIKNSSSQDLNKVADDSYLAETKAFEIFKDLIDFIDDETEFQTNVDIAYTTKLKPFIENVYKDSRFGFELEIYTGNAGQEQDQILSFCCPILPAETFSQRFIQSLKTYLSNYDPESEAELYYDKEEEFDEETEEYSTVWVAKNGAPEDIQDAYDSNYEYLENIENLIKKLNERYNITESVRKNGSSVSKQVITTQADNSIKPLITKLAEYFNLKNYNIHTYADLYRVYANVDLKDPEFTEFDINGNIIPNKSEGIKSLLDGYDDDTFEFREYPQLRELELIYKDSDYGNNGEVPAETALMMYINDRLDTLEEPWGHENDSEYYDDDDNWIDDENDDWDDEENLDESMRANVKKANTETMNQKADEDAVLRNIDDTIKEKFLSQHRFTEHWSEVTLENLKAFNLQMQEYYNQHKGSYGCGNNLFSWIDNETFQKSDIRHFEQLALFDGIKYIPDYAFADCKNLEVVWLPSSVQRICKYAFAGCDNLKMVKGLNPNIQLDKGAFWGTQIGQNNHPEKYREMLYDGDDYDTWPKNDDRYNDLITDYIDEGTYDYDEFIEYLQQDYDLDDEEDEQNWEEDPKNPEGSNYNEKAYMDELKDWLSDNSEFDYWANERAEWAYKDVVQELQKWAKKNNVNYWVKPPEERVCYPEFTVYGDIEEALYDNTDDRASYSDFKIEIADGRVYYYGPIEYELYPVSNAFDDYISNAGSYNRPDYYITDERFNELDAALLDDRLVTDLILKDELYTGD